MASRAGTQRVKQKAAEKRGPAVHVVVDGRTYSLHGKDMSAVDTAAMRRAMGFSFQGLLQAARVDFDIDLLAGVMWMSRRGNGEPDLTYDQVAAEVTYEVEFDVLTADAADAREQVETHPEA